MSLIISSVLLAFASSIISYNSFCLHQPVFHRLRGRAPRPMGKVQHMVAGLSLSHPSEIKTQAHLRTAQSLSLRAPHKSRTQPRGRRRRHRRALPVHGHRLRGHAPTGLLSKRRRSSNQQCQQWEDPPGHSASGRRPNPQPLDPRWPAECD